MKTKIGVTAEELKKRLTDVENQVESLNRLVNDAKMKLSKFLDKRQPDEFTKKLYANGIKFNPQTIMMNSATLNKLNEERELLREAYANKLREDLIIEFCLENPDLKDKIKDVIIERTESGLHAKVLLE